MAHLNALLRNKFNAQKRKAIEAQIDSPLPVLSEIFLPASAAALPKYKTGYNKRKLRYSQITGRGIDAPVLCVAFCASAYLGQPDYAPALASQDIDGFLDVELQAQAILSNIMRDHDELQLKSGEFLKSQPTSKGHIYQCGIVVPISRPKWERKGSVYVEPNNNQLAIFARYLLDKGYVEAGQAHSVFSARVMHLAKTI